MILKKISLDTNVINYCAKEKIFPETLSEILEKKGYVPLITPYVIYELARAFIDNKTFKIRNTAVINEAKKLFTFIKKLDPFFCFNSQMLSKREVEKLKTNAVVTYLSENAHLEEIQKRIDFLSEGKIELWPYVEEFISQRQSSLSKQRKNIFNVTGNRNGCDFEEIKNNFLENIRNGVEETIKSLIDFLRKISGMDVNIDDIKKFSVNINSYPVLKSSVLTNLYLQNLTENNKSTPKEDRFTDLIILTESSYCEAFLSDDKDLIKKHAKRINSDVVLILLEDLDLKNFGKCYKA